jgi:hypothetical protein
MRVNNESTLNKRRQGKLKLTSLLTVLFASSAGSIDHIKKPGVLMKKYAVILTALCLPGTTMAENLGIEKMNFALSALTSDSDIGNEISVSGRARFPLAGHFGASISGKYSDFNGKNGYLDSSTNFASLGIFVRKFDLGIINATYDYSRSEFDPTFDNSKKSIHTISLSGTYYFNDFDFGLGRSKVDPDSDSVSSFNTSKASISYYVDNNFVIGATILKMDADDSVISASFQPTSFGNNVAISASYLDSDTNDTFSVSLRYYFDTKVSLKDRARRY